MSRRAASVALALYPLAFKRRYGVELRALLDESQPSVRSVLDLLRGALVAHVRPPAGLENALTPAERVRASASGVLACWVVFAATGFGFYKTTEDAPFAQSGERHALLAGTHLAIQLLAAIGSAAVVIGAAPLVAAALASARREPRLRGLVGVAPLAVAAFGLLTGVLVLVAHGARPGAARALSRSAFVAWGVLGLGCGVVCVVAARKALFAIGVGRAHLIGALVCGSLATVAMAAIAIACALYATALSLDASTLASSSNGPFGLLSTRASLIEQAVVMTFAAAFAAVATARGWRGARKLGRASAG
jgi:hypothetical protein